MVMRIIIWFLSGIYFNIHQIIQDSFFIFFYYAKTLIVDIDTVVVIKI